jgi:hypothetical protein
MIVNENNSMPYMKSLATCVNKMVMDGYTEDFKVTEDGMQSLQNNRYYTPEQVRIINFFRFEGQSSPEDNAILYVIETDDGCKGTLVDAYGVYTDPHVSQFINQVEDIQKKTVKE